MTHFSRSYDRAQMRHGIDFKTHSQCQRRGADPRYSAIGSLRAGSDFLHWSVGTITAYDRGPGGAYRDRTDDLKLAKLALSQLS